MGIIKRMCPICKNVSTHSFDYQGVTISFNSPMIVIKLVCMDCESYESHKGNHAPHRIVLMKFFEYYKIITSCF